MIVKSIVLSSLKGFAFDEALKAVSGRLPRAEKWMRYESMKGGSSFCPKENGIRNRGSQKAEEKLRTGLIALINSITYGLLRFIDGLANASGGDF